MSGHEKAGSAKGTSTVARSAQAGDGSSALPPVVIVMPMPLPQAAAFARFTHGMGAWWPLESHSIGQANAVSVQFDAREGGRIQELTKGGETHIWGTITRWDPPRGVSFTWHPGRDASSALDVSVSFEQEGALTELRLVHSGWERLGSEGPVERAGYAEGWSEVLSRYRITVDRRAVPMRPEQVDGIVDYFHEASAADLERLGVDKAKLPPREEWKAALRAVTGMALKDATTFYYAWLVDGEIIGHAALKDIRQGDTASIHLHMWEAKDRGQGHGAVLFCRSALDAYQRFDLRRIICEPSAANPMPNRMLSKIGFPLTRSYVGASSDLSARTTLNQYSVDASIAQSFLDIRGVNQDSG